MTTNPGISLQENKYWSHSKIINRRGEKSKVVSKDNPDLEDALNVESPAEDSSNDEDGKRSSSGDRDTVKVNKPMADILKQFAANYSPGSKSVQMLEAILADTDPAKVAKLSEQMQEEDAEKRRQKEDAGRGGLPSTSDNETHAKATNSKLEQGGMKRSNRTIKKPPRDSKYRKMSDHLWPIF